jgi:hypothetical protein
MNEYLRRSKPAFFSDILAFHMLFLKYEYGNVINESIYFQMEYHLNLS